MVAAGGENVQFVQNEYVSALFVAPVGGNKRVADRLSAFRIRQKVTPKIFVPLHNVRKSLFRNLAAKGFKRRVGRIKVLAKVYKNGPVRRAEFAYKHNKNGISVRLSFNSISLKNG